MNPAELRAAAADLNAIADQLEGGELELAGASGATAFDWSSILKIVGPILIQVLQQLIAPTPTPVPGPKK